MRRKKRKDSTQYGQISNRKPGTRQRRLWFVTEIMKLICIAAGIGLLFFDSLYGICFSAPFLLYCYRHDSYTYAERIKKRMRAEFKDFLVLLSGNLTSGYALENAFIQTASDLKKQYGEHFFIKDGIDRCVYGVQCNQSIDVLFCGFADEVGIQEIIDCAGLLSLAKQHGGNMIQMLRRVAENMTTMVSAEQEIETSEAQKKLESRVMLLAPFGIMLYMRLTNASYMSVLYNTVAGHVVMATALLIITLCGVWMNHIIRVV